MHVIVDPDPPIDREGCRPQGVIEGGPVLSEEYYILIEEEVSDVVDDTVGAPVRVLAIEGGAFF
jgi:hypothetical protein